MRSRFALARARQRSGGTQGDGMDTLDQLKAKYRPVLDVITQQGVKLAHLHVQDGKLFMQGAAPSPESKNRVWDAIKAVDPTYADLTCDLTVDASLPQPAPAAAATRDYTVARGDSLWKIAQHFYGKGQLYPKIIAANPGKLKDENSVIHPGDVLKIPAE